MIIRVLVRVPFILGESTKDPMADEDKKEEDPKKDNPPKEEAPSKPQDGQAKEEDVPEKFRGKSAADIAKSYIELEKKLGENSNDVAKVRKELELVGQVIEGNPELKTKFLAARQNAEATFGSIPSSGGKSGQIELTPKQRETARKMGISEADYIKEVIAIQKGE